MRLLSYNILDGGADRFDLLRAVIAPEQPDVVVLVEADDPSIVEQLAVGLEMDFIHAEGRRHGGAVLVRGRIAESANHSLLRPEFSDLCLEATIDTKHGRHTLAAVHLHPRAKLSDEAVREREIAALLDIFAPARAEGRPHFLAGDFNANSPVQQIVPEKCKEKTGKEFEQNGGMIPRTAVAKILSAGYLDTFHAVRPKAAETIGSFTTEYPGQRVDYIFSYGIEPALLKHADVIQTPPADKASDHFPVALEIA